MKTCSSFAGRAASSSEICPQFDEISQRALAALHESSKLCGATSCGGVSVSVEERTILLEPNKKGALIKDVPASVAELSSEKELRKYSLEALRKLASNSKLNLGKSPSRDCVLLALTELFHLETQCSSV